MSDVKSLLRKRLLTDRETTTALQSQEHTTTLQCAGEKESISDQSGNEGTDSSGLKDNKDRQTDCEYKRWKCEICGEEFVFNVTLIQFHMLKHGEEWPYKCVKCNTTFTTTQSSILHSKSQCVDSPWICGQCGNRFSTNEDLQQHFQERCSMICPPRLTLDTLKRYKCTECCKRYLYKSDLENHLLWHQNLRHYKCESCGKSFNSSETLTYHKKTQCSLQSYTCDVCDKVFKGLYSKYNLETHSLLHINDKSYQCDECDKAFDEKLNFNIHKLTHGGGGNMSHACAVCLESYTSEVELKRHLKMHTTERQLDLKCGLCYGRVLHLDRLQSDARNSQIEWGEDSNPTPYMCGHCNKQYRGAVVLSQHIRKLHTAKPFERIGCCHCLPERSIILSHSLKTQSITVVSDNWLTVTKPKS